MMQITTLDLLHPSGGQNTIFDYKTTDMNTIISETQSKKTNMKKKNKKKKIKSNSQSSQRRSRTYPHAQLQPIIQTRQKQDPIIKIISRNREIEIHRERSRQTTRSRSCALACTSRLRSDPQLGSQNRIRRATTNQGFEEKRIRED